MNTLSAQMLAQLYAQESNDPFLVLVTLSHPSFASPIRLVRNSENITSRGNVYSAYPFSITLPADDGERIKEVNIEFDNVSLLLVDEFRSITGDESIAVKVELILASIADDVQYGIEELRVNSIQYDRNRIRASLRLDDFLNTEMPGERYTPTNFRGLY